MSITSNCTFEDWPQILREALASAAMTRPRPRPRGRDRRRVLSRPARRLPSGKADCMTRRTLAGFTTVVAAEAPSAGGRSTRSLCKPVVCLNPSLDTSRSCLASSSRAACPHRSVQSPKPAVPGLS